MAKKSNHRTVVFLKEYAGKKASDEFTCDGHLSNTLVNLGVAEYKTEGVVISEAPLEFNPLPEVAAENNSDEKVSEPVSKQKSSSKAKNKK